MLLNNGPRKRPQPDSSSSFSAPATDEAGKEGGGDASRPSFTTPGTPLDQLLYRSDVEIGARGDIIMFYNKVFISLIKGYALRFTPGDNEVSISNINLICFSIQLMLADCFCQKVCRNSRTFFSPVHALSCIPL